MLADIAGVEILLVAFDKKNEVRKSSKRGLTSGVHSSDLVMIIEGMRNGGFSFEK